MLPLIIIELGRARCNPGRLAAVAVLDAIGVMFLSHRAVPVNSPEVAWLARRSADIVAFAEEVLGEQWQTEVPEAAAILQTVRTIRLGTARDVSDADVRVFGMGSS